MPMIIIWGLTCADTMTIHLYTRLIHSAMKSWGVEPDISCNSGANIRILLYLSFVARYIKFLSR